MAQIQYQRRKPCGNLCGQRDDDPLRGPDLLRKYQHKLLAAAFLYIWASALTDWCPVTIKFDNFAIKIDNLQLCLIKTASQRN